jgi:uncharacterized protein (DUF1778 family)
MTLRLTDDEFEVLKAQAERERRSMHEVVRLAILDRAARHRQRTEVLELAERGAERHREILNRLA